MLTTLCFFLVLFFQFLNESGTLMTTPINHLSKFIKKSSFFYGKSTNRFDLWIHFLIY